MFDEMCWLSVLLGPMRPRAVEHGGRFLPLLKLEMELEASNFGDDIACMMGSISVSA